LKVRIDNGLAPGCVRVAAGVAESAPLGALAGRIGIEKAAEAQAAE
jgi:hypothetical protein